MDSKQLAGHQRLTSNQKQLSATIANLAESTTEKTAWESMMYMYAGANSHNDGALREQNYCEIHFYTPFL